MSLRTLDLIGYSFLFGALMTGVSYVVGLQAGWISGIPVLECVSVFCSYACTYLCVKQSRWNYPLGMVATLSLAWLAYGQGLYGQVALNIYLPIALIYGWWRWGPDEKTRTVKHLELVWVPVYIAVTVACYVAVYVAVSAVGGTIPQVDAAILVLSILAQFLLDNKKVETWLVWIFVNILSIWLFFDQGLYLIAFQFVFFLGNAFWGWWSWMRTMPPSVRDLAVMLWDDHIDWSPTHIPGRRFEDLNEKEQQYWYAMARRRLKAGVAR